MTPASDSALVRTDMDDTLRNGSADDVRCGGGHNEGNAIVTTVVSKPK